MCRWRNVGPPTADSWCGRLLRIFRTDPSARNKDNKLIMCLLFLDLNKILIVLIAISHFKIKGAYLKLLASCLTTAFNALKQQI